MGNSILSSSLWNRQSRWVDFLVLVLGAHGAVLQKLSESMGEDVLVEIFENIETFSEPESKSLQSGFWENGSGQTPQALLRGENPYEWIEINVRKFSLPPRLEFYLWSYPYYRTLIESSCPLYFPLASHPDVSKDLINEALAAYELWIKDLCLPEKVEILVSRLGAPVWKEFETLILRPLTLRSLS